MNDINDLALGFLVGFALLGVLHVYEMIRDGWRHWKRDRAAAKHRKDLAMLAPLDQWFKGRSGKA